MHIKMCMFIYGYGKDMKQMYSYQLVVIGAGEKQYLQYQVENVEFLYSIFSNKQKNQIKSREKMQDK
jgi:hypothetical protein